MGYPQLCKWILFKKRPDGMYSVRDCATDTQYTLGSTIAYFASRLDGKTDPFSILPGYSRRQVQEMLDSLQEENFLRYGRLMRQSKGCWQYTLIIPRKFRSHSLIPMVIHYLLLFLWLPTLLWGIGRFFASVPDLQQGSIAAGQWLALLLGSLSHEAAHACAALCYGARVFEAGALLHHFMPGFYVMIDATPVKSRLRRVHIDLAGVKMNLFLAGMGLLLSTWIPSQSGLFCGFALCNGILGLTNLTFAAGLDGLSAMGLLLGSDHDLVWQSVCTLLDKNDFRRLCKAGPHGIVELFSCTLILLLQLALPAFYLLLIMEVVEWFL